MRLSGCLGCGTRGQQVPTLREYGDGCCVDNGCALCGNFVSRYVCAAFRLPWLRNAWAASAHPTGIRGRMLRGQRVRALWEFCFALCLRGFQAALAAERVGSECPPYGNTGTDAAWTTGARSAGILFCVMSARLSGCLKPYHSSQCRFLRVWKVQCSVCCRPSWLYRNSAVYSVS